MELAFQGLKIRLPFESVIGIESFVLEAAFNAHVSVQMALLMEEEKIRDVIHGIGAGDGIEVYEDGREGLFFSGIITDAEMLQDRSLCYLKLKALSHTMEWGLVPVSRSYVNLDATYEQVIHKVLQNQPGGEILDCVTKGTVIPDFLLQYEESDWDFLVRLASHFQTFMVPDCCADHGRAYFGIPDSELEYELSQEDYREIKDLDKHFRMGSSAGILPQESIGWEVTCGQSLSLAQKIRFRGISAIVTNILYHTENGELMRSYKLGRRKGALCVPKKNPHIFGMSIPATVKERSGNCVRVHFHIDPEYDDSPNTKYFPYAIESSFIYCMPEVGSQVHIYFPGDDEKAAAAVHAIRTCGVSGTSYAEIPDNKSFSNINGAELMMTPSIVCIAADREGKTSILLDTQGNASISGKKIEFRTEGNLLLGEPISEEGEPLKQMVLEADSIKLQVGEEGSQIELTEEAKIIAVFVRMTASDTTPASNPSLQEMIEGVTANDESMRTSINEGVTQQLVDKYEEGRSQYFKGIVKIMATVTVAAVAVAATVCTGGATAGIVAPIVLGTIVTGFAASDTGEGLSNMQKSYTGDLSRGHNFLRDDVFKNDTLYYIAREVADIAFGVVSGKAIGSAFKAISATGKIGKIACNSKELAKLKTVVQVGGNVLNTGFNQLADTGTLDPYGLAVSVGIGLLQGQVGTRATASLQRVFQVGANSTNGKVIEAITGTILDTGIEWAVCELTDQEFHLWESLARNAFANFLAAFISDPVDAVTGAYTIKTTDFILASLPAPLVLERIYRSTNGESSVLGRGWDFPYASRIFRDTQDMAYTRVHMNTVTGHSLCFEWREGVWENMTRGTDRFVLETSPEGEEPFLLQDVWEHTLYAYNRQGLLRYVEYPNKLRLALSYGKEGLERITTPLGNVLEVRCKDGRILEITDEIGRRTQYRYEGELLTDVVNPDEGMTHYEYDKLGRILSVTDQNGKRCLDNEYDERGRITSQSFPGGVHWRFAYDEAHKRNTIFYSETGKTEIYEYNDRLLLECVRYEDGTRETFLYNEDNCKICETSRLGHRKEWEYDAYGRVILERYPDGLEEYKSYDQNHDLERTWDSEGRETCYSYDSAHNLTRTREKIEEGKWRETTREYDCLGRCVLERDSLGNETRREYAPDHSQPIRVLTPREEETRYDYDQVGRRTSIGNVYGTVELSYNSRNFVTKRKDGEGYISYSFYDRMGNLTSYFPPRQWEEKGKGYEYRYDSQGRLADIISPLQGHRRQFRNFDGNVTAWIHPVSYAEKGEEGEGSRYEYDSNGSCIRIRYPDGGVERRFYDSEGHMTKQVLPEAYQEVEDDGAGWSYAYDAMGRLTEVKDPEGNRIHTYEYNGHGQVTREVDGEGKETLYAYNGLGLKTREQISVRKEEGLTLYRTITYLYDSQGNKVEERYGQQETQKGEEPQSWHSIVFSYDPNNRLCQVEDGFGARVRYDYDLLGNLTRRERTIAEGTRSLIRYGYNKNGWLREKIEEIQGNGQESKAVTRYGYDANGNLIKTITPKGFEIHREYDGEDRLVLERVLDRKNGIDRRVKYDYDQAGNVTARTILGTEGESLCTSFCYDYKDRLTARTDPSGARTRFLYDREDRLIKEISPYGWKKGTAGIPEAETMPGTCYAYDSRGNRIRVTNAFGELVQETVYNQNGQPVTERDAFGGRTCYAYEMDGQIKEVRRESPTGRRGKRESHILQQYEYNSRGQITGIIDGNRSRITCHLDSWGRITEAGYSDGTRESWEYTPTGQVSRVADGKGNAVTYHYNSLGRVSERRDQLGQTETFLYDLEGNLACHTDRDGRILERASNVFGQPVYEKAWDEKRKTPCISTWRYDSLGRLIRGISGGHSYEYSYDSTGRLKEKRSAGRLLVSYVYDQAGQVKEIRDGAGTRTCYEYDLLGRRSRVYNHQGLDVRYAYDALNRVRHIRWGKEGETAYTYDGVGNLKSLETKAGGKTLLYLEYLYDGNGNRTAKKGWQRGLRSMAEQEESLTGSGTEPEGTAALDISWRYDVQGRLLEERRGETAVCYTYDPAGNRIGKSDAKGETIYHYNQKNQLIMEESPEGKKQFTYDGQGSIVEERGSGGVRRYVYDSRHRQIRVETETGQVQENRYDAEGLRCELAEGENRLRFVYHKGELLWEEEGEEKYTGYHLGVGGGVAAVSRGGEISYLHQDEQYSTALITDEEGSVLNSYLYDAFGADLESAEQLSNRIRYTGQQYDSLTGQYYLRARYYNPVLGRFLQEDAYQGDGMNLYAYCANNPVTYYDPSGYKRENNAEGKCPSDAKNGGADGADGKGGSGAGESGSKTGTIWDNIKPTQSMREGTQIPKSFSISIDGQEFWVNPNGTKHMYEYVTRNEQHIGTFTMPISSQSMLTEFEAALKSALNKNGLKLDEMIHGGDWEFIIVPPREEGLNYVIKHSRYNPQ